MPEQINNLATHGDVTIDAIDGHVYSRKESGESEILQPPRTPATLIQEADLATNNNLARDANGYVWTRLPTRACFTKDGQQVTVEWKLEAYEAKYGWEYSHTHYQRTTWNRLNVDESWIWIWVETVEQPHDRNGMGNTIELPQSS